MRKKTHTSRTHVILQILSIGTVCVTASFWVGFQTSGNVDPFTRGEAAAIEEGATVGGTRVPTLEDAIAILEVAQGYRAATRQELLTFDVNGDGALEADDALRVLHTILSRR